jgi:uncharacterized protein (DUF2252 family)
LARAFDLADLAHDDDHDRTERVVATLADHFDTLMRRDPAAFRTKFRKMAADPFAFYRGTAALFFDDVAALHDPWATGEGRRVWIQADLHAENFGTYIDSDGRLVFDVNDFDEAYLGHWTWDLQRFVASLALLCWRKALPDEVIDDLVATYVDGYLDQVDHYTAAHDDTAWALTLDTARGAVLDTLRDARMSTRVDLLESTTVVEDYRRRFRDGDGIHRLEDDERRRVVEAFERYVDTIPDHHRSTSLTFDVLDVVGISGIGIGSAGLPAYNVLIEGYTQALDNDVVLLVKQGNQAAPSRVVGDPTVTSYFHHHGHRTALSQRALQAHADQFLGWTEIDGTGYVVAEFSPYEQDLSWDDLTEPAEMVELVEQLGRATAKVHCVADEDADADLVSGQVEDLGAAATAGHRDALVADLTAFAHAYAERTRRDHALFVDAFRAGAFRAVDPTASSTAGA